MKKKKKKKRNFENGFVGVVLLGITFGMLQIFIISGA